MSQRTELTIRHPDGTIETVIPTYQIIMAERAGQIEIIDRRMVDDGIAPTPTNLTWDEIMVIYDEASKWVDRDPAHCMELRKEADALKRAWAAKYPREQALKIAEAWGRAANYAKATAGDRAAQRIKAGEDHVQVLAEMEAEWAAHVDKHIWD